MAHRILGLDLGARSVKAVLLESSLRGFSLAGAAAAPVPAAAEGTESTLRDRQVEAARQLIAARGWVFDTSVVALPGTAAATHVATLPFTDPRRIEQTAGFEIEAQIPWDLADVAWDWQTLSAAEGRTEILASVVRKDELAGLLAALAGAGIDPRAVVPPAPTYAVLWSAGALAGEAPAPSDGEQAPAEALLDVGDARTSLCVVQGGQCQAARTFPFGARDLARALAREMGAPEAACAALLSAEATGSALPPEAAALAGDARAAPALRRALVPLARELRATLRAWQARHQGSPRPLRRLLLAGEVARLPGLAELLASEVEGTVEPLTLAGPSAEGIAAAEAPGLALALALALRGHQGSRAPRLNLRRGDLAYTRDFQHLRGRVVRLGVYASLVLLLALVSSSVKVFALSRHEALLDKALCDATQKLVGKCFEDYAVAESVLKGKGTPAAAIPKVSALDVFTELSIRTPQDFWLKLDRIEITRDKLHLQGSTDAAENVDRFVGALRGGSCFGDARSGGARKRSSDGKFEFTIDSDLTCDTGAGPAGGRG